MSFGGGGAAGSITLAEEMINPYKHLLGNDGNMDISSDYATMFNNRATKAGNAISANALISAGGSAAHYWLNLAISEGRGPWVIEGSTDTFTIKRTSGCTEDLILPSRFLLTKIVEGLEYQVIVEYVSEWNPTTGTLQVKLNGGDIVDVELYGSSLTAWVTVVAGSDASDGIRFIGSSDFDGVIKHISLYTMIGNPYTDANSNDPTEQLNNIKGYIDSHSTKIDTYEHKNDWESIQDTALAKADTTFADDDISTTVSNIITNAITNVGTQYNEAVTAAKTDVATITTSADIAAKLDVQSLAGEAVEEIYNNITFLLNGASGSILPVVQQAVSSALTSAVAALTDTPINDIVDDFEQGLLNTHMRSINRFAGGMSEINAVNSSAFVIGMALLESDFQKEVSGFRAKMSVEMYTNIVSQYLDIFKQSLTIFLYDCVRITASYFDVYKTVSTNYLMSLKDLIRVQTEVFNSIFSKHLGSQIERTNTIDKLRFSVLSLGNDVMTRMLLQTRSDYFNIMNTYNDYEKLHTALDKERNDRNLEIDNLEATWDLSLLQVGGQLLAAPTGAAGYIPNKPTANAGNVAGAAIQGAVAGAGFGGPPGAVIGGIGGLLTAFGQQ